MGTLSGQSFVIIGGTTGLGLSAAQAIVRAGGRVVVTGRSQANVDAASETLGTAGHAIVADASKEQSTHQAISTSVKSFGSFDGLYHVAGGSGRRHGDGPLHEISEEGWAQTMDWNLRSVFRSNQAAVQAFIGQKTAGTILNMASVLAYSPSSPFFTTHAYATAKAGILGLTKSCAAHYAKQNIRFNAIAPALVATPMSERAQSDEAIMTFIKRKQPLDGGRIGSPSDLDAAVVFLLSKEARFVTGQTLTIDGGWSVSEGGAI